MDARQRETVLESAPYLVRPVRFSAAQVRQHSKQERNERAGDSALSFMAKQDEA